MVRPSKYLFFCISFLIASTSSLSQQLAFPTAEGFGKFTSGGRSGEVAIVTNLSDNGPGSLREAIDLEKPRTIVFQVSGTIILESPLIIKNNDLTIAGQTAPGDGICLRGFPTIINADNIIIRYIRFRLGDENRVPEDALMAMNQKNIIIDHCSMSWGVDEVGTFYDNEKLTVQWCIISESLNRSFHPKGDHGYGGIWGGIGASFHHNILAHHASRTPRFHGSRYHKKPEIELVDFRNNVIYNWGFNGAYGGESGNHNIVANYYKAGPATKNKNQIIEPWDAFGKWYVADNFVYGNPIISKDNWLGGVRGKYVDSVMVNSPFLVEIIKTQNTEEAFAAVLENAGATFPKRDSVDKRIIDEIKNGTATYSGIFGPGIIDSQKDVGGWPKLKSIPPPKDTDKDGIPDIWEIENGLDVSVNDANLDSNKDGYTNIENYINSISHRSNR
ncbi:MAG: pectate lyase [Calditrichaeota bacterium]|nr:MAG: pectate lyase [Calditrichota bacterium]MBL1204745.1 pectate lyase [Calditrichota bacterium]NOG44573.1 pectate lyase [Calditrichota bacterium]